MNSTGSTQRDGLSLEDLVVRFGGTVAVNHVSLTAPVGRITGLIGPNGAGKTTTFNAACGTVPLASGRVRLLGQDVTRRGSARRARLGLGRTFQRIELFGSLSVADNIGLGLLARQAGASPWRQVVSSPARRAAAAAAVEEALDLCAITDLAAQPAALLPVGRRRLVELARAYAGDFRVLLLDEPSSGLDHVESAQFARILREMVARRGMGVLLVEHDMSLVMTLCEHIYVLDFGTPIFDGSPAQTQDSAVVRAAYLGDEDGLTELEASAAELV